MFRIFSRKRVEIPTSIDNIEPTFEHFINTTDKLRYLNQYHHDKIGWSLIKSLVKNEKWDDVNKFIDILIQFNADITIRSRYLSTDDFLLPIKDAPAFVILNLLNNFHINNTFTAKLAKRSDCFKAEIIAEIQKLEDFSEQLAIFQKCLIMNESLGCFINTRRGVKKPQSVEKIHNIIKQLESKIAHNKQGIKRCIIDDYQLLEQTEEARPSPQF